MRRAGTIRCALPIALIVSLVVGFGTTTTATADVHARAKANAVPSQGSVQPYEATMVACRRAGRTEGRVAIVGAAMRPIAGGTRLALRIDLFQRQLPSGRWVVRTDVPGLGVWMPPSDPTIGTRPNDVFKYRQAVGRLIVPYAYRFRVGFRWYDAAGAVVREESAVTPICREPDLRPDLVIVRATVDPTAPLTPPATAAPGQGGDGLPTAPPPTIRYVLIVRNVGRTSAFGVNAAVSGSTPTAPSRAIRRLQPQETAELTLTGPACVPGAEPIFLVDPAYRVDEARETNNTLAATCPATLEEP